MMVMEESRQPRNQSEDPVVAAAAVETGYPGGVMNSGMAARPSGDNGNSTLTPSLRVREATPSKDDLEDDLRPPTSDDEDDEAEAEADDESSCVSVPRVSTARFSPSNTRPSRERRHSTVINPYPMLAPHHSGVPGVAGSRVPGDPVVPMASAIPPHLDLTIGGEQSIKRRSKSTTGPLSISPPTKALRSGELEDLPLRPYHYLQHYHHHHNRPSSTYVDPSSSPQPNFYAKPPLSGLSYSPRDPAATRHHSVSGAHHRPSPSALRFRGDDYGTGRVGADASSSSLLRYPYSNLIAPTGIVRSTVPAVPLGGPGSVPGTVPGTVPGAGAGVGGGGGGRVYRQCPHKIAEENHDPAKWEKNGGGKEAEGGGLDGQQQQVGVALMVQRTHSNPEMECCPLCMARNQCEILVRRTYSKVSAPPRRLWMAF